jgi:SAM-dependent methyltransferase
MNAEDHARATFARRTVLACPVCSSTSVVGRRRLTDVTGAVPGDFALAKCGGCGSWWVRDPVLPADLAGAYGPGYYSFSTQPLAPTSTADGTLQRARRRVLAARYSGRGGVLAFLGRRLPAYPTSAAPGKVLDVGCGAGDRLRRLAEAGWRTYGVDVTSVGLDIARDAGIRVARASGEQLPFRTGTLDAVILSHSIEHTYDPVATLREAARVTRPGGEVIVTTPNPRSVLAVVFGDRWVNWDVPRHTVVLSRAAMETLAAGSGLKFTRSRGSSTGWSLTESLHIVRHGRRSHPQARPPILVQLFAFATCSVLNLTPFADETEYVFRRR